MSGSRPRLYLLTRLDNDFGSNVLDLVARLGLFEAGDCVNVDHDKATNQLRVLGRGSLDDIRQLEGGGHCEVLLSSTRRPPGRSPAESSARQSA
jgi:hypothetical protein